MSKKKNRTPIYLKCGVFFFILLICTTTLFSQGEHNIWYFGNKAGVDFNTSPPTALSNSQMYGFEGCASISDGDGNLLFYSDGDTIWNKEHNAMPNGTGLQGSFSSSQNVIIIPQPGSTNLYYIFTVDAVFGSGNGLTYSLVDMSLDGGRGDIVTGMKNISLTLLIERVVERVTAVVQANCKDIWILTLGRNNFYAFKVTSNGVETTPVISPSGILTTSIGMIKASPDGKKLVVTQSAFGTGITRNLFDFDNSTGIISNRLSIGTEGAYGVDFSPSGKLLYIGIAGGAISQYDLTSPNIEASRQIIGTSNETASIQLAPDGKIYISRTGIETLAVINDPDSLFPNCNFVDSGFALVSGTQSVYGLPQSLRGLDFSEKEASIITSNSFCSNDTVVDLIAEQEEIGIWSGSGIINDTLGFFSPFIAGPGNHQIIYSMPEECGGSADTINIRVNPKPTADFEFTPNTIFANDPFVSFEDLSISQSDLIWEWLFGELEASEEQHPTYLFPNEEGCYEIQLIITDNNGCRDTTKKKVLIEETTSVFIPNTFTPNKDGFNDTFSPKVFGVEKLSMVIYNRWGKKIFETQKLEEKWDGTYKGKSVPNGVYIIKLSYSDINGNNHSKTQRINLLK